MPLWFGGVPFSALEDVEQVGASWAAWHDGFGTDEFALRGVDGVPTPGWEEAVARTWPVVVAGRPLAFGVRDDGWFLRWSADGSAAGLTRIRLGPLGAAVEASLEPDGPFDWFAGYDPVTDELSVFVEGVAGEVELTLVTTD